jgi:DNA end-binding protein Ku
LLREALRRTDQVGVAKVVIKTRQHLAAVKPEKKALVLELMHFADELIEPGSLQIPDNSQFSPQEFKMAIELIERMAGKWDPSKYSDDYRNALLDLIHKKIELGDEATVESGPSKRKASKVIDLVSILKESLEKTRGKSAESKPKRKLKKAA